MQPLQIVRTAIVSGFLGFWALGCAGRSAPPPTTAPLPACGDAGSHECHHGEEPPAGPEAAPAAAPPSPAGDGGQPSKGFLRTDDDEEDSKTVYKIAVGKSPVRGNPAALVTIIEFADFQCSYCARVEEKLKKIASIYDTKVRFAWKNHPLPNHANAEPAAQLALEARAQKGDDGFWDVHDRMFQSDAPLEAAELTAIAKSAGLRVDRTLKAIDTHKYASDIAADDDLSDDMNIDGTPSFFINGRRLVGDQPLSRFQKIIDEEINRANDLLAAGTPPAELYPALIRDGREPPAFEKRDVARAPSPPFKGKSDAKVVIQQFSDFQCSFCESVELTIAEVMKHFGDRVKIEWRNLPLGRHPEAGIAAVAAMETFKQKGASGFWKMHRKLFDAQKVYGGLKRDKLDAYAKELGLDLTAWNTAFETNAHAAQVEADVKAARDAGLDGTPAFVINGYVLVGAQPYAKFRKVIEKALAETKATVKVTAEEK